jgi:hypothetical protein
MIFAINQVFSMKSEKFMLWVILLLCLMHPQ